ncbi:MAG TPA: type IV toxin-antitoxin system AbiEi family antitoxin domain-containing protein [Acidimicrobiia bacterium]
MSISATARLSRARRQQFGVFTPKLAEAAGVNRTQVRRLLQRGDIERLFPAVYGLTAIPDSWERRAIAAQLAGGGPAVLSHGAAAKIHGLQHLATRNPALELTYPRDARPKDPPVRAHESYIMTPDDIVSVGCFLVTSALFTIGALALRRPPVIIAKAIDAAVVDRRTTVADVRELIVRMWHTPGVVCLREALHLMTPGAELTRSEMERLFLRICELFGLPRPEVNVRVVDANGDVRYVDFLFREVGLVVEINAHPAHGTTLGVRLDGSRQNALTPRFQVLNYDGADLTDRPEVVAKEVRRALDELGSSH